jgi:predicted transcriptional regulator
MHAIYLNVKQITYEQHVKELLKNKRVREEYEKLLPEYELARSIIEQRLKKKMTQEEVDRKAGMPQSTISRIEGLTHGLPKISTLKKIANALDAKVVVRLESKRA